MPLMTYQPRDYAGMTNKQIENWFNVTWKMVCGGLQNSNPEEDFSLQKRILELHAMARECKNRPKLQYIVICVEKLGANENAT
jgi:hypothetical protein